MSKTVDYVKTEYTIGEVMNLAYFLDAEYKTITKYYEDTFVALLKSTGYDASATINIFVNNTIFDKNPLCIEFEDLPLYINTEVIKGAIRGIVAGQLFEKIIRWRLRMGK